MKIGKAFATGLMSLSLTAFAIPCWASAPSATHSSTPNRTVAASSHATQIAFDSDAEEHHEHHEEIEHGRERVERHTHSDSDEEHGGARNLIREHIPGTDEHEMHEEREGEEHHSVHHSESGY
jgi:hypothetical protein